MKNLFPPENTNFLDITRKCHSRMVELDFGVVAFQEELVHYRLTMKWRRRLGDGNDGDHLFSHKTQTDEFNHNRASGRVRERATEGWPKG